MAHRVPVKDGRLHFGAPLAVLAFIADPAPGVWTHAAAGKRDGVTPPPLSEVATDKPVTGWLHRNQWIAECPDCKGTQFVWLDEPLFLCSACWNGMVGGAWRPVTLPENRAEIERIMLARPLPQNRNWNPALGMTLAEYRAENVAHGFPAEVKD